MTTSEITFAPTASVIGLEADPETTGMPFTVTVESASDTVGVTVIGGLSADPRAE